jgi:3-oxoacyl-[acyl-carrier protein] reductase
VAPGYIETTSMRTHMSEPKIKEITNSIPLKRLGKVEEVVSAVKFVITNEYINGTVLDLDGGQVL